MKEISLDKVGIKLQVGKTSAVLEGFVRDEFEYAECNTALDALESLILAHACEGIDVASEAYQNGVQTALDACANNL